MEQSRNNCEKSFFLLDFPFYLSLMEEPNEIFMFGSELEALINVDYNP